MITVVIGGGPAGLALAIELRQSGLLVVVVDRGHPTAILGETFRGEVKYALQRLGVSERLNPFLKPLAGRRARWGTGALRESSTLFNPHGSDFLLDRSTLESALRQRAVELGVTFSDDHVTDVIAKSSRWQITLGSGRHLECDFIVDASGRAMWLSRHLHSQIVVHDRLVAAALIVPTGTQPFFEIESARDGWWYRVQVREGETILMLMTDADMLPINLVQAAKATQLGADAASAALGPVRRAYSSHLLEAAGSRWAAIGDAAHAWDPISGYGLQAAFASAHLLAQSLTRTEQGDYTALAEYRQKCKDTVDWYGRSWRQAYSNELRWSGTPFWRRRQSTSGGHERIRII
jgi:flavin-dependent dehydrogenase